MRLLPNRKKRKTREKGKKKGHPLLSVKIFMGVLFSLSFFPPSFFSSFFQLVEPFFWVPVFSGPTGTYVIIRHRNVTTDGQTRKEKRRRKKDAKKKGRKKDTHFYQSRYLWVSFFPLLWVSFFPSPFFLPFPWVSFFPPFFLSSFFLLFYGCPFFFSFFLLENLWVSFFLFFLSFFPLTTPLPTVALFNLTMGIAIGEAVVGSVLLFSAISFAVNCCLNRRTNA